MAVTLVKDEILRFLSAPTPEVLCIRGAWGAGKTYAWNKVLLEAKDTKKLALGRYAYVSLFGIASLDELKYSIFENSVSAGDVGIEPSLETLRSNAGAVAKRMGKQSLGFLQQVPLVKSYAGNLGPIWFQSVRETIVCIDDVERRSKSLLIRDVLGLVSNLRENRKCKIALILNDEALAEDAAEFRLFFEKVVDVALTYAPSPEECVKVSLSDDSIGAKLVGECAVTLGVSNIRVVKKIERLAKILHPMVVKFDEDVFRQAVSTMSLLGWCLYEPNKAPPLEFVKNRKADPFGLRSEAKLPENEAAWTALLDVYGFQYMDEFDEVVLMGIEAGFFNPALVDEKGSALNGQVKAAKADKSFSKAWSLYHDSFESNHVAVLDAIYESFKTNVNYISALNLNGTVSLLKDLGRPEQAAEVVAWYMKNRNESRKFYDLAGNHHGAEISDPDVVAAFNQKFSSYTEDRDPARILIQMAQDHGWSNDDLSMLASMSVDDYYKILKSHNGRELKLIIGAMLQFGRISNATPPMIEILNRGKAALRKIGEESPINARRVKRYGIQVAT